MGESETTEERRKVLEMALGNPGSVPPETYTLRNVALAADLLIGMSRDLEALAGPILGVSGILLVHGDRLGDLMEGMEALAEKVDAMLAKQMPEYGEGCDHCGDPSGGAKYCPACAEGHRDD